MLARRIAAMRRVLKDFYARRGKNYPWRRRIGPFRTLVTECLLQRTRAEAVREVWRQVITSFGSPRRLAEADAAELRALIAPLGLTGRADRLPLLGQEILREHGGRVPHHWGALIALPGVGAYVAGATRSFGFGVPEGIVDANVIRVFQKITGIVIPQGSRRNNTLPVRFWLPTARLLARTRDHREVNYGLLDFAAEVCRPRDPQCLACPFRRACAYAATLFRSPT